MLAPFALHACAHGLGLIERQAVGALQLMCRRVTGCRDGILADDAVAVGAVVLAIGHDHRDLLGFGGAIVGGLAARPE